MKGECLGVMFLRRNIRSLVFIPPADRADESPKARERERERDESRAAS